MSDDPFESDEEWYARDTMRKDFERGVLERADAEDRERFEAALGQPRRVPGPGERFSQFDTVEEDRGER
jgi:hypothetical protein